MTPTPIRYPTDAEAHLRPLLQGLEVERLAALFLGSRNQVLGVEVLTSGTFDATIIDPRLLFRRALLAGPTCRVILAHNHPSGDLTPSVEDLSATYRVCEAGRILGIEVADHLILIDDGRWLSMSEHGHIPLPKD